MIRAECKGSDLVMVEYVGIADNDWRYHMTAHSARRFAAELIVAAERAERLESDQRAPG